MGRTFELGNWDNSEQLCDRLHEYFQRSGLTDWLKIAERAMSMREDTRLTAYVDPMLYAVAAQAWDSSLWLLAEILDVPSAALVWLVGDVGDTPHGDRKRMALELIAHGNDACDVSGCWICDAARLCQSEQGAYAL